MPDLMRTRTARDERDAVLARPADLHDLRFQTLLGEAAWGRLPQAVRDRFSKRLRPGLAVTYAVGLPWLGIYVPADNILPFGFTPFILGDLINIAMVALGALFIPPRLLGKIGR